MCVWGGREGRRPQTAQGTAPRWVPGCARDVGSGAHPEAPSAPAAGQAAGRGLRDVQAPQLPSRGAQARTPHSALALFSRPAAWGGQRVPGGALPVPADYERGPRSLLSRWVPPGAEPPKEGPPLPRQPEGARSGRGG